jgi:hypothetical protein
MKHQTLFYQIKDIIRLFPYIHNTPPLQKNLLVLVIATFFIVLVICCSDMNKKVEIFPNICVCALCELVICEVRADAASKMRTQKYETDIL